MSQTDSQTIPDSINSGSRYETNCSTALIQAPGNYQFSQAYLVAEPSEGSNLYFTPQQYPTHFTSGFDGSQMYSGQFDRQMTQTGPMSGVMTVPQTSSTNQTSSNPQPSQQQHWDEESLASSNCLQPTAATLEAMPYAAGGQGTTAFIVDQSAWLGRPAHHPQATAAAYHCTSPSLSTGSQNATLTATGYYQPNGQHNEQGLRGTGSEAGTHHNSTSMSSQHDPTRSMYQYAETPMAYARPPNSHAAAAAAAYMGALVDYHQQHQQTQPHPQAPHHPQPHHPQASHHPHASLYLDPAHHYQLSAPVSPMYAGQHLDGHAQQQSSRDKAQRLPGAAFSVHKYPTVDGLASLMNQWQRMGINSGEAGGGRGAGGRLGPSGGPRVGVGQRCGMWYSGGKQNSMNGGHLAPVEVKKFDIPEGLKVNPGEFDGDLLKGTRYFVIKSNSSYNVQQSILHGVWCSTAKGNEVLNSAYMMTRSVQQPLVNNTTATKAPSGSTASTENSAGDTVGANKGHVLLFFSVNNSRAFCGVAEMIGPVGNARGQDNIWSDKRWQDAFQVRWIYIKSVPNNKAKHIYLPEKDNKPVTYVRDATEIKPKECGEELLRIIHEY